jgi:hypothetical protein
MLRNVRCTDGEQRVHALRSAAGGRQHAAVTERSGGEQLTARGLRVPPRVSRRVTFTPACSTRATNASVRARDGSFQRTPGVGFIGMMLT